MSKKLLGEPIPLKYLVITNPDGGHSGQSASPITLKEARQLLKNETICVYVFKVPTLKYHNLMFKYPLSEYYSCLEINLPGRCPRRNLHSRSSRQRTQ